MSACCPSTSPMATHDQLSHLHSVRTATVSSAVDENCQHQQSSAADVEASDSDSGSKVGTSTAAAAIIQQQSTQLQKSTHAQIQSAATATDDIRPGSVISCDFVGQMVTGTVVILPNGLRTLQIPCVYEVSAEEEAEMERFKAKYLEPSNWANGQIRKDIDQALYEGCTWFHDVYLVGLWDVAITYDPSPNRGWPESEADAFECVKQCLKQKLGMTVFKEEFSWNKYEARRKLQWY